MVPGQSRFQAILTDGKTDIKLPAADGSGCRRWSTTSKKSQLLATALKLKLIQSMDAALKATQWCVDEVQTFLCLVADTRIQIELD